MDEGDDDDDGMRAGVGDVVGCSDGDGVIRLGLTLNGMRLRGQLPLHVKL